MGIILIASAGLYYSNQYMLHNSSENLCRVNGGGWAPAGMDSGELQTIDGNRLSNDSPLIDHNGYTCYCHTENTYWNGKTCASIPSSSASSSTTN